MPGRESPITTTVADALGFIELRDELDITAVAEIEAAFRQLLERGAAAIVVDCSRAEFVDSKLIEALMRGAQAARSAGARVAAECPDGAVRRAFEIGGLDSVLPVRRTRAEAIRAAAPTGAG